MTIDLKHFDLNQTPNRGISRRNFGRLAAYIAAGAALPLSSEQLFAQLSSVPGGVPSDAVKIDANENPMGPCPEAIQAAMRMVQRGGRYNYQETEVFAETLAKSEGVEKSYVRAYPGSSLPLHHAVIAFTSAEKPLVVADPGYEAAGAAARISGANVIRVPLASDYAHDVKAMVKAAPNAGCFYICNPNNPTGTLTSREDLAWLLQNKPEGSVLLLDEAYIHIAGAQPCTDWVAQDKDLVILRTFSKIYGMAGLRAGAAIARPDLLEKMSGYNAGALPTTAMAAATASLNAPNLVPTRRKIVADTRTDCLAFLNANKFDFVPSVSNKFMVDVRRPAGEIVQAMRNENVYIGRVWPVWPTFCRVTVGTPEEMEIFKKAFLKVTA
jgi:histidinol-phosphate aminotransferase